MGFNFHKSVKIADGVKLNIGKKSAGVSVGGKYAGASFNSKSGASVRASIPGTGVSYTKSLNSVGKKSGTKKKAKKSSKSTLSTVLTVIVVIVALVFIVGKNWDKISDTLGLGKTAVETTAGAGSATGTSNAATATGASDAAASYVINTSTKKVHLATCRYADTSGKNMETTDKTLDELLADGYSKCKTCMK